MTNLIVSFALVLSTAAYACVPAFFFSGVPGKYSVAFTSGGQTFRDELEITTIGKQAGLLAAAETLQGTYTTARFHTALEGATVELGAEGGDQFDLTFTVEANEGGKTFPVYFLAHGNTQNTCELKGEAYADVERTQPIAELVIAKQNGENCKCSGN